jgi:hypothetical protein
LLEHGDPPFDIAATPATKSYSLILQQRFFAQKSLWTPHLTVNALAIRHGKDALDGRGGR